MPIRGFFAASSLLAASGNRFLAVSSAQLERAADLLASRPGALALPAPSPRTRERPQGGLSPDPLRLAHAHAQALRCAPKVVEASGVHPDSMLDHAAKLDALRRLSAQAASIESGARDGRLVLSAALHKIFERMNRYLEEARPDPSREAGAKAALEPDLCAINGLLEKARDMTLLTAAPHTVD